MTQHQLRPEWPRFATLLIAAIAVAACGGGDDSVSTATTAASASMSTSSDPAVDDDGTIPGTVVSSPTTDASSEPPIVAPTTADEAPAANVDDLEVIELSVPADSGNPKRTYTVAAFDGTRFTVDESFFVFAIGDRIYVDPLGAPSTNDRPGAYVAIISKTPEGGILRTVADVVAQMDAATEVTVEPTGTALEAFGYRLAGFRVAIDDEPAPSIMFSSGRLGADVPGVWGSAGDMVYLADTPAGVLAAGHGIEDGSDATPTRDALAMLISEMEFTGSGFAAPLATGNTQLGGGAEPPPPADPVDDGPEPLTVAFTPIDAGRYQLPNFGLPVVVDVSDGWELQPNFPGFVVMTDRGSGGPGDRDVVLLRGVDRSLTPMAGGPSPAGAPFIFDDIAELLDSPPAGVAIADVVDMELAGESVTRFDLSAADDLTCTSAQPCDFAVWTDWGYANILQSTGQHRFWWFNNLAGSTALITASANDPAFIERATTLVESLQTVG